MAEPRPAVRQGRGEEAPAGLRLRPRRGLRQNQSVHPDASDAVQPGGAAGGDGAEDRPLPAEGKRLNFKLLTRSLALTSWEIVFFSNLLKSH